MKRLNSLFEYDGNQNFMRVILSDDFINIKRFKDNQIAEEIDFEIRNKLHALDFLNGNSKLPVEIVIACYATSCRSISKKDVNNSEIKNLIQNLLKGSSVNLICYSNGYIYKDYNTELCEMNLSPVMFKIFEELISIKNPIDSVICWPFWIVSSYFKLFPNDAKKFRNSIFVTTMQNRWSIITLHNGKYVYLRSGLLKNFEEQKETKNVIEYLIHAFNIDTNDIGIYYINEEVLNGFTFHTQIKTKLYSSKGEMKFYPNLFQNLNPVKIACGLVFLVLFTNTVFDTIKVFNYDRKIEHISKSVKSLDPNLSKEVPLWENLDDYLFVKHIDIKSKLKEKMKDSNRKFKNASIKLKGSKDVIVNAIYDKNNG